MLRSRIDMISGLARRRIQRTGSTAPHPLSRGRPQRIDVPSRSGGTTLLELMITLSIAAILLAIGVPSYQNIVATNRIAAVTNELSAALQLARSEAVTRGRTVTVCKSDDITATPPVCDAGANWQDGWVVFVDDNDDGDLDAGEIPIKVGQPSSGNAVITTGAKFTDYVKLQPNGEALGAGNLSSDSFAICIAPNQRSIVINSVGRIRIDTGTCP